MKKQNEMNSVTMHQTVDGFYEWLVTRGLRPPTLHGYQVDLNQFHTYLGREINGPIFVNEIGLLQLEGFVSFLVHERKVKPRTINRKMNALSTYFKYLKKNKWIDENPAEEFERVKVRETERTYLSKEEIEKIIQAVTHPVIHYFVKTMAHTGIRINECIHLTLRDVDLEERVLKVIDGKGGKNRTIPLNDYIVKELKKYLTNHRPFTDSLYFFALQKSGTVSEQYVNRILKEATLKTGIEKHVTSHILRHSFASHLVKQDIHVAVIQRLLGHASLRTTSVYLHVNQDDLKEAVNRIDY